MSALMVPNPSLQLHRTTQVVCAIDRVYLGTFDLGVCVVEPVFDAKQLCQFVMNRLLDIALGSIYAAESAARFADQKLMAFLWDEVDRVECGCFCGVEMIVLIQ